MYDLKCVYLASTFGIIKITTFQMIYYCLLFNGYNITLNSFCLFFLLEKKEENHLLYFYTKSHFVIFSLKDLFRKNNL